MTNSFNTMSEMYLSSGNKNKSIHSNFRNFKRFIVPETNIRPHSGNIAILLISQKKSSTDITKTFELEIIPKFNVLKSSQLTYLGIYFNTA